MHITIIGENMRSFYNTIKTTTKYRTIKNYWKIDILEDNLSLTEQINIYFNWLKKINNEKNLREAIIIKIPNVKDEIINIIMEKMNNLKETYNMPLVLLLYEKILENGNKLEIDLEKNENIDPRLFFLEKYDENRSNIEDKIEPILLRFCSIHNEFGDRIIINGKEDYDLIDNYFPFNLNLACVGRFGQGKSTGVNSILREYKAKESSKGVSQTKSLTFYQVTNQPIRILDIPGFEDENTVKLAIDKFKICGEKLNNIKDHLHIILYFLNYHETRAFMKLEFPMLEEILKHKSSKLIYVITHSPPNLNERKKNKIIDKINSGLKEIFENNELNNNNKNKIGNEFGFENLEKEGIKEEKLRTNILTSTLDNTIFVNFHKDDDDNQPFGEDLLFQKIHDFFVESKDYKNFSKKLDPKAIENRALKLRAEAKEIILSNKIWGAVVGIVPGVDWALQKFVIKKNAAKKIGKIFGIDVSFLNESKEKKDKKEKIQKNEKKQSEIKNKEKDIIDSCDEKNLLNLEVEGEKITKESNQYKIGNSIKLTTETGAYIGGGLGIGRAVAEGVVDSTILSLRIVGTSLAVVGAVIGVGLGGYFTNKYCEELLDTFVELYKQNAEKIENSYKKAAEYFSSENINNLDNKNV